MPALSVHEVHVKARGWGATPQPSLSPQGSFRFADFDQPNSWFSLCTSVCVDVVKGQTVPMAQEHDPAGIQVGQECHRGAATSWLLWKGASPEEICSVATIHKEHP